MLSSTLSFEERRNAHLISRLWRHQARRGREQPPPWLPQELLPLALPRQRMVVGDAMQVPELAALRSGDALYAEFQKRKAAHDANLTDSRPLGGLLYAAIKHATHEHAGEMINCCALHRVRSATCPGHLAQAIYGFRLASRLDRVVGTPMELRVATNLAFTLNVAGALPTALKQASKLIPRLSPDHPLLGPVCSNLGFAAYRLGKLDLAANAYRRAMDGTAALPGAFDLYRLGLAATLTAMGQVAEGAAELDRIEHTTTPYFQAVRAQVALAQGDHELALILAEQAIQQVPPQMPWTLERALVADLHRYLALAHTALGHDVQARNHRNASIHLGAHFGLTGGVSRAEVGVGDPGDDGDDLGGG